MSGNPKLLGKGPTAVSDFSAINMFEFYSQAQLTHYIAGPQRQSTPASEY